MLTLSAHRRVAHKRLKCIGEYRGYAVASQKYTCTEYYRLQARAAAIFSGRKQYVNALVEVRLFCFRSKSSRFVKLAQSNRHLIGNNS